MRFLAFVLAAQIAPIQYSDVPPVFRPLVPLEAGFARYLAEIESATSARIREGEFEHLIYYVLQSGAFTSEAIIEPALSARIYIATGAIPEPVTRRVRSFLAVLGRPARDERLQYFQKFLPPRDRNIRTLIAAYSQSMRFLHANETLEQKDVYESRGLSSDTRLASSFTIWNALGVLKATNPRLSLERVLIVGPGSDFAPRTGFDDSVPPRSYQPYAVADALVSLGLAKEESLSIDCADVNDRVLASVAAGRPRFRIEPGSDEFFQYQRHLAGRRNSVKIVPLKLNIVTQRLAAGQYGLIIATNVLLYLPKPHLALAAANIREMLVPGGYFIHNELRPETETYTRALGFEWLQTRRILIAEGRKAPLYDTFSMLRRSAR